MRFVVVILLVTQPLLADATAFFNEGVEHQKAGRLIEAREAYEKSVSLDSKRVDALANLGLIYLQLKQPAEAVDPLRRVLALRPDLTPARFYLALALYASRDLDRAAQELDAVLRAQPSNPQAMQLRGSIALKKGEMEQGIDLLEKSLALAPNNRDAAVTLATAYVGVRETEKAEALLEGFSDVTAPEFVLVRGAVLHAKGLYAQAAGAFGEALRAKPGMETAHGQLGLSQMMLGEHAKAAASFRAELARNPDDYTANANLGLMYLQDKRYGEAKELLDKARRVRPEDPGLLYLLAQVYAAKGQHEEAAAALENVNSQRPEFIPAWVLLARTYAKLKRPEDSARVQRKVRELNEEEQARNLQSAGVYGGHVQEASPAK